MSYVSPFLKDDIVKKEELLDRKPPQFRKLNLEYVNVLAAPTPSGTSANRKENPSYNFQSNYNKVNAQGVLGPGGDTGNLRNMATSTVPTLTLWQITEKIKRRNLKRLGFVY